MIEIVSGTDRANSNSLQVARFVVELYREHGASADLLDLTQVNFQDAVGGGYFGGPKGDIKSAVSRMTKADGILFVVPEYNGSYPGILKLFIDYWKYPDTFEARPVAFIGLGGRWGGLRPVEHLQQVFGYRNGYVFPQRLFLSNVKDVLKDGRIVDPMMQDLLKTQTRDFLKFLNALQSQGLDANSRLKATESK